MTDTAPQPLTQPTMKKTLVGANDDGTPKYNYEFAGPEGGGVLRTGPISATVALKDGTVYDLSEDYIAHHPGHAGPLAHHIDLLHERTGRLVNLDGSPFVHTCSDDCGDEADQRRREAAQPASAAPAQPSA